MSLISSLYILPVLLWFQVVLVFNQFLVLYILCQERLLSISGFPSTIYCNLSLSLYKCLPSLSAPSDYKHHLVVYFLFSTEPCICTVVLCYSFVYFVWDSVIPSVSIIFQRGFLCYSESVLILYKFLLFCSHFWGMCVELGVGTVIRLS